MRYAVTMWFCLAPDGLPPRPIKVQNAIITIARHRTHTQRGLKTAQMWHQPALDVPGDLLAKPGLRRPGVNTVTHHWQVG